MQAILTYQGLRLTILTTLASQVEMIPIEYVKRHMMIHETRSPDMNA